MLTLSDINALTDGYNGDVYSDLYKDVHGCRPRNCTFESLEDFQASWDYLVDRLEDVMEEEMNQKVVCQENFEKRVADILSLISNIDRVRAIEILADAEGELQSMEWYGYESLEYHFGLGYGYIKGTLQE